MTDDEIIELADAYAPKYDGLWSFTDVGMIAFARAIAAKERDWQGLTDEEIEEGYEQSWVESKQAWESAVWWAEAKLKDKNT